MRRSAGNFYVSLCDGACPEESKGAYVVNSLQVFSILKLMKRPALFITLIFIFHSFHSHSQTNSWIRINLLGYATKGIKVAVFCTKESIGNRQYAIDNWQLVDAINNQIVFSSKTGKNFGAYGPFT